jgi:hypothetical protein
VKPVLMIHGGEFDQDQLKFELIFLLVLLIELNFVLINAEDLVMMDLIDMDNENYIDEVKLNKKKNFFLKLFQKN